MKTKKKVLLIVFSLFALLGFLFYRNLLTISVIDNDYKNNNKLVTSVLFSNDSGFFSDPFYLELSNEDGNKIYYTLDSTDPDENSNLYLGPIYIDNATSSENNYSMNTDISTGFYEDLIEEYGISGTEPGYVAPDYLVEKCNVVRAIAIDKFGNKSDIETKCFFVGIDENKYKELNIISIVTDPSNLFDDKIGIFVTGNEFKKGLTSGAVGSDSFSGKRWRFWPANYRQTGERWERPAYIEIYDYINDEMVLVENQKVGIRTQGGQSRGISQKSINVFARKKYESRQLKPLFEDESFYPTKITLSSGGNEDITKINDYLVSKLVGDDLSVSIMEIKPAVLFIDGEYWGFYLMSSSINEDYIAHKYGVSKNNIFEIKNGEVEIGKKGSDVLYSKLINFAVTNDLSIDENYLEVCSMIDMNSFIDYYAMMTYISRQGDWPNGNNALWTVMEKSEKEYNDGKFRWIVFDCNSTCMNKDVTNHDTINYIVEKDSLFASLWVNANFRSTFLERLRNMSDEIFDYEKIENIVEEYDYLYRNSLHESWDRYYGSLNNKESEYEEKIDSILYFFKNRKEYIMNLIELYR